MSERHNKIAFGDFQTPLPLARDVCALLRHLGVSPRTVIEPTCGIGGFLEAAIEMFGNTPRYYGFDINPEYIAQAEQRLKPAMSSVPLQLQTADFFAFDWPSFLSTCEGPVLLLGNPPWVTNATLGAMGADNLPLKSNVKGLSGLSARTGKANFDISEWMLSRLIEAMSRQSGSIAMLCKTGVARKVLEQEWRHRNSLHEAALYRIDAASWFNAAVDACLFVGSMETRSEKKQTARYYASLSASKPETRFGLVDGHIVSNVDDYSDCRYLNGISHYRWRSGIKHDLAKVMELTVRDGQLINGFGEALDLESTYLYPLLKCTDLSKGNVLPSRCVIVPQSVVGEDTRSIAERAPKTWNYLCRYAEAFAQRKSSIYRNQPDFAIFGIGPYSFAPYKIAVSSLHKEIRFNLIPPVGSKPVFFDDTCYCIGVDNPVEAEILYTAFSSKDALRFLRSMIFPDSKRPVTAEVLNRLSALKIAEAVGREAELEIFLQRGGARMDKQGQLLFEESHSYNAGANQL